MKNLMALLLIPLSSFAKEFTTETQYKSEPPSLWSVESSLTRQSLLGSNSPALGITALYNLKNTRFDLGLRATTSLFADEKNSENTAMLVQRYTFYKTRTNAFVEFNQGIAFNEISSENIAHGAALGLKHDITQDLSIGGLVGFNKVALDPSPPLSSSLLRASLFFSIKL